MHSTDKKVAIIGMGAVGSGIAYALTIKDIANEIVLIDINEKLVNAEMLDIRHGIPHIGRTKIRCGSYQDIKDSDLIIVTAGKSRNANQTRLDLAFDNIKIADSIATEFEKYYTKGVILIVSNPVDIITHYFTKRLALPQGKIFGTGCILDGSRLVNVLSDYLNLGPEFINISVIGEHGNSQIPVWSHAEAAQIPLEDYCKVSNILFDKKIKEEMEEKVLKMGTEIISGKGKTFYGISTCVCYLADAILNNNPVQASVSSFMTGQNGLSDVALSMPSIIDSSGIKLVLPVRLNKEEHDLLMQCSDKMKDFIANLPYHF